MKFSYRTEKNAKAIAASWGRQLDNKEPYIISSLVDEDNAELFVFDVLGWPFNDINAMIREISAVRAKNLLVRLNSPGGDIIDTFALYQALKNHRSTVTVRIESLAASAASVLAMSGDKIEAYQSSLMMIHNAWVVAVGNRFELQDTANILEKIDTNMQDIYTAKTKIGKREISEMLKNETWLNAKEMKEKGFIDTIIDGKAVKAQFDLSMFAHAPDDLIVAKEGRDLTKREIERALRDVGASREFAKAIAAGCSEGATDNQREVESLKVSIGEIIKNIKK